MRKDALASVLETDLDPGLYKVSEDLAIMAALAVNRQEMTCIIASGMDGESTPPEPASRLNPLCDALKEAAEQTSEMKAAALASNSAPSHAYLFFAWGGGLGLLTTEQGDAPVGLFKTMEGCQDAEASLRKADFSTRRCRILRPNMISNLLLVE